MRIVIDDDYVKHYGVKGQKWGVHTTRRGNERFTVKRALIGSGIVTATQLIRGKFNVPTAVVGTVVAVGVSALIQKNQNKKLSEITSG